MPDKVADRSHLVFKYLNDYRDLMNFYAKENTFPDRIAQQLGTLLATFHRDTYQRSEYQEAIAKNQAKAETSIVRRFIWSLERLRPEIFGVFCINPILLANSKIDRFRRSSDQVEVPIEASPHWQTTQ
jgi:hypothetical protein